MRLVYEFDAAILQSDDVGSGAFVLFPYDVRECFGRANLVPVRVTFDGIPYRGSIANMGAGPCIGVLKSIRAKLGKGRGDVVRVTVELDEEPRAVEPPDDLSAAFVSSPKAEAFFKTLSVSNKRLYADLITSAKKQETRAARVARAIALLENGVKKIK